MTAVGLLAREVHVVSSHATRSDRIRRAAVEEGLQVAWIGDNVRFDSTVSSAD